MVLLHNRYNPEALCPLWIFSALLQGLFLLNCNIMNSQVNIQNYFKDGFRMSGGGGKIYFVPRQFPARRQKKKEAPAYSGYSKILYWKGFHKNCPYCTWSLPWVCRTVVSPLRCQTAQMQYRQAQVPVFIPGKWFFQGALPVPFLLPYVLFPGSFYPGFFSWLLPGASPREQISLPSLSWHTNC